MVRNLIAIINGKANNEIPTNEEMAVNRRGIMLSSYSAETASNLIGGNFLTGLLLLMKADDGYIGLITVAGMLGNILQVLSPLILERFARRKKLLIFQRAIVYLFNVALIGIIAVLPFQDKSKLYAVMAVVILVSILNALFSPGFAVWHIRSIPESIRTRYYSFYRISSGIIIYAFTIGASALLDFFKSEGNELKGHMMIRIGTLVLCAIDLFFLTRVKEYPAEKNLERISLISVFINPFRQHKYLKSVLIGCLWNFAGAIPGPYYSIYLLQDMGVNYSYINTVSSANIPILIIFTPIWASVVNRTSWFKTLYICMGAYLLHFVGLSFVTKETMLIYPIVMIYALIFFSGISLVFSNVAYINIPENNQTNYIGFFQTMNFSAAMLGVSFGRAFIKLTDNVDIRVFGIVMQNKQYLMIITAIIMAAASVIICLIQKDKSI